MTGKEMLVVLGGAAVLGAGAGTAAAVLRDGAGVVAAAPLPPAGRMDVALLERLEAMEKRLAEARAALDEARAAIKAVEVRAEEAATAATAAREAADATASRFESGAHDLEFEDETEARPADAAKKTSLLPQRLRFHMEPGKAGEQEAALVALGDISGRLKGLGEGLRLRMKPEAERWAQAKEDLGLSDGQVADLQAAIADRDRAMADAMVTEKRSVGQDGEEITIKRLDAERAATIQRDHKDRINRGLTAEQQKGWQDKGYDHAFGSSHGGGLGGGHAVSIMAVESSSTWVGGEESAEKSEK